VVVKGSTIANNTIAVGTKHNSIDVTAGIGTNSITLADLAKGTSTVPLSVKITSNGVAALSDTLVFTGATEDVSGLYSTVTLSGVDTIGLTAAGTLTMNAASVSGQTIAFTADVNTLTLEGTESADVISISKVTNDALDTIAINGGLGADTIVGHAGIDKITGGAGADTITGGTGVDTYIYTATTEAGDTITDFTAADDLFLFTEAAFGAKNAWTANALISTAAAATDTYFEVTAAPTSTGVDLNAAGTTTDGFVVVGAATGTAGVKVYYTTGLGDFKLSNSTLVATLTGISTGDISAANFTGQ
jgi:Ca2+-binding RTX toxin-like protein